MSEQNLQVQSPVHAENAATLSKHMSQVVAKSWLPEGKEIRQAILSNDSARIKKAFEENGCDFSFYEGYGLEVDYDSFEGNLKEFKHTLVVSYPPRPSEFNLSDEDLRDWIADNNSSISTPTHPYIPATF